MPTVAGPVKKLLNVFPWAAIYNRVGKSSVISRFFVHFLSPKSTTENRVTAYQDFFTLWKDADPDIPVFKQAKTEYAKLQ